MGQKVNPKSFRLNSIYTWDSSWFSEKNYSKFLREDILIKDYLRKKLSNMGIAKVGIKRSGQVIDIDIYSSKPGMIIGRGGSGIDDLRKEVIKNFYNKEEGKNRTKINLNIKEVKNPNLSAELVAQGVVADLEKRMPFRRAIKQAAERVKRAGAKGVKIKVGGRLNGAEIARSEKVIEGNLPLHTLRADIDYALKPANTIYGVIGVKVWIYKGDIFNKKNDKNK
jgi:small subunit ribosomal protein S3